MRVQSYTNSAETKKVRICITKEVKFPQDLTLFRDVTVQYEVNKRIYKEGPISEKCCLAAFLL